MEEVRWYSQSRFDWNCQQHITPRFSEGEISEAIRPLRDRLAELEAENAQLRAQLVAMPSASATG